MCGHYEEQRECECCRELIIEFEKYAEIKGQIYCKDCIDRFTPQDFIEMFNIKIQIA